MQTDRGGAEGIGFNDVGARFEILDMNFLDDFGLRQLKKLEAAFKIFAFPIAESSAAVILLGQLIALDHRAHGAVEQDNAFAQEGFEGVKVGHHLGGELNGV